MIQSNFTYICVHTYAVFHFNC